MREIEASELIEKTIEAAKTYRIIVHEGGARSGKTWQLILFWIQLLKNDKTGGLLSIVRKSGNALRTSAERDFFEVLNRMEMYDEGRHNRTSREYRLSRSLIEFLGIDNPQKKRGAARRWLWLNEANELERDDFRQLAMRTEELIILDYNPSDEHHWIYDDVLTRPDCTLIKSTYRDNPFLDPAIVAEIEGLKDRDEASWKIFGLGERAHLMNEVYPEWRTAQSFLATGQPVYGLDFGMTNASALVQVGRDGHDMYVRQLIYQSGLTTSDIIPLMKQAGVGDRPVYCDAAEPDRIVELKRAGFTARPADKAVRAGIDFVRSHRIFVVDSPDVEKELRAYKWREDRQGNRLDEPVKYLDHAMDAMRYAAWTAWGGDTGPAAYSSQGKRAMTERGAW